MYTCAKIFYNYVTIADAGCGVDAQRGFKALFDFIETWVSFLKVLQSWTMLIYSHPRNCVDSESAVSVQCQQTVSNPYIYLLHDF